MDADKAAQPDSIAVNRPDDDVKRGGYGSGRTPATELAPPSTGVKPDSGGGDTDSSGSKE
jgi:hypothetical protein